MAVIMKTNTDGDAKAVWGRKWFILCMWEYKLVQPLWKSIWRFLKKLKIDLTYDKGYHLWVGTKIIKLAYLYTHVYHGSIHNSQVITSACVPISG
jgi:hypothetical protein